MEKRKPHFPLAQVKALLKAGKVRFTKVAYAGAAALGMGRPDMLKVISELSMEIFDKSMTSNRDSTRWMDVYKLKVEARHIYLKLAIEDELLVISFKENTDEMLHLR